MNYAALTTDDFLAAAQALMPRGAAWRRDGTTLQAKVWRAIAEIVWNFHQSAIRLFNVNADPLQTQSLLSDWQAAYAITPRGTEDQQRAQLVTVITQPGGTSSAQYAALATQLGISPFSTVVTGAFAFTVHAPAALSVNDRTALKALINANNRITVAVTFVYDL